MTREELFRKNQQLSTEFELYLLDHPEIEEAVVNRVKPSKFIYKEYRNDRYFSSWKWGTERFKMLCMPLLKSKNWDTRNII